jgi:hypothetical protein
MEPKRIASMMRVITDDVREIVLHEPHFKSACRLVVCKDYRPLNFPYLSNLLLRRVGKIGDFFVFGWWWQKKSAISSLSELQAYLKQLIKFLANYPPVDSCTTFVISSKGLFIALPNRPFLELHQASDVIELLESCCLKQ